MSESKKVMSASEIECWTPPSLRYVVGCSELKKHFAKMLGANGVGPNTLITGESQTGKTATVRAYVETLLCPNRDLATLDKCGKCAACRQFDTSFSSTRLSAYYAQGLTGSALVQYASVDCHRITSIDLQQLVVSMRNWGGLPLVYLDDVDWLPKHLEGMLLKALEERRIVWIAAATSVTKLSKSFLHRFKVISTSPASQDEFVQFLQERCMDWGIPVDAPESLVHLAQRSKLSPASAIRFFADSARKTEQTLRRQELVTFLDELCKESGLNVDSPETLVLLAQRSKLNRATALGVLILAAGEKDRILTRKFVLEHLLPEDVESGNYSADPGVSPSEPIE